MQQAQFPVQYVQTMSLDSVSASQGSLEGHVTSVWNFLPTFRIRDVKVIFSHTGHKFSAESFVYGKYVNNISNIIDLRWLPIKDRRDFNSLK